MKKSGGPNQWPSALQTIPRAVLLFFRADPVLSSLQAAITVVRAVLPLLVLGVAKLLVDAATEPATGGMVVLPLVGEPADPVHGLYLLGALLLSIWLLDKATWSAEEVVRTYSTNRVESHVHALIMRKCSTLDAAFYESPEYLDMLERAVRGALMNALSFMWGFYLLLSAATSLVATIAVLSTIHWAIPVAMVLAALPQLIATSHFSRKGWALENSLATHFRLLKYLTALMSERQAANEVRLFGLSDYFVPRFREVNDHRLRREQAFTRRSTLWRAGLGVVSDVAVAGVWVFISVRYALTARENGGFGDVAHVADLRRVSDAAVAAGVEQDLATLADGYETFLGGQFGIGRDLSGGQWQKVGLARGFMRRGSHAELAKVAGLYSRMFETQASGYR